MGCDIHMYVEYRPNKTWGSDSWQSFNDRMNPGRDYHLFGLLAGVRGGTAIIEPRGLPSDLGYYSESDNYLYISDDIDGCATLEKAKLWNKNFGCKIIDDAQGKPFKVEHPDWHSHSWLTLEEFENVLSMAEKNDEYGVNIQYWALLDAMKRLATVGDVRVVFWFDN